MVTQSSNYQERLNARTPKMAAIFDGARQVIVETNSLKISLVTVARQADMASQGIYRYFSNSHDLYLMLLLNDFAEFQNELASEISKLSFPHLSGQVWVTIDRLRNKYPILQMTFANLDSDIASLIQNSKPMKEINSRSLGEFSEAQRLGVVRPDLDIEFLIASMAFVSVHVLFPLVFKGEYGTPEWWQMSYLQTAALMYPVPDFGDPAELHNYLRRLGLDV